MTPDLQEMDKSCEAILAGLATAQDDLVRIVKHRGNARVHGDSALTFVTSALAGVRELSAQLRAQAEEIQRLRQYQQHLPGCEALLSTNELLGICTCGLTPTPETKGK